MERLSLKSNLRPQVVQCQDKEIPSNFEQLKKPQKITSKFNSVESIDPSTLATTNKSSIPTSRRLAVPTLIPRAARAVFTGRIFSHNL